MIASYVDPNYYNPSNKLLLRTATEGLQNLVGRWEDEAYEIRARSPKGESKRADYIEFMASRLGILGI